MRLPAFIVQVLWVHKTVCLRCRKPASIPHGKHLSADGCASVCLACHVSGAGNIGSIEEEQGEYV